MLFCCRSFCFLEYSEWNPFFCPSTWAYLWKGLFRSSKIKWFDFRTTLDCRPNGSRRANSYVSSWLTDTIFHTVVSSKCNQTSVEDMLVWNLLKMILLRIPASILLCFEIKHFRWWRDTSLRCVGLKTQTLNFLIFLF